MSLGRWHSADPGRVTPPAIGAGPRAGRGPDDDPRLRKQLEATRQATTNAVLQVLGARGIADPDHLAERLADTSPADLDAALACRDDADYLACVARRNRFPT